MAQDSQPMIALNLRVTRAVHEKLASLARETRKSRAAIVRALILRATPEDLPPAWVTLSDSERAFLAEVER
jgi:predicted transcriptional regulator